MDTKSDIIEQADALIMRSCAYKKYMAESAAVYSFRSLEEAAKSLVHFSYWVHAFPDLLRVLRARVDDEFIVDSLNDIIDSEEGRDEPEGKPHYLLLIDTLVSLGLPSEQLQLPIKDTYANRFVSNLARTFGRKPVAYALGVQYALEKLADPMLKTLRSSLEQISSTKNYDSKYFDIHIVAEEEHGDIMERCLLRISEREPADLILALNGAQYYIELFDDYWELLYKNAKNAEGALRP